jgi:hypothetical protein
VPVTGFAGAPRNAFVYLAFAQAIPCRSLTDSHILSLS